MVDKERVSGEEPGEKALKSRAQHFEDVLGILHESLARFGSGIDVSSMRKRVVSRT